MQRSSSLQYRNRSPLCRSVIVLPQQQPHVMFKVFPAIGVGIDYWHGRVAVICLDLQEKTHLVDKHLLLLAAEKYSDYQQSCKNHKHMHGHVQNTNITGICFFIIWQFSKETQVGCPQRARG